MPASPASSIPPISPGEMQLLLSRAGLVLNPGQVADLVLAWRQIAGLIAAIPHDRPLADDLAYVFRLPPPVTSVAEAPPAKASRKPKAAAPRAKAAPKRKAKRKAAAKRSAARPAGRKRVRRGR